MTDQDVVPYVCTLDPQTAEKALRELHEDPRERLGQVEAFREWIQTQPHLRCRTDTRYLLTFLRGAKFSQLRARVMLEGNLSVSTKFPEWFRNVDPLEEKLRSVLESGYVTPLPQRNKDGCSVLLYRPGRLDAKVPVDVEIKAGVAMGMFVHDDELTQVNGSIFVFDFTGLSPKHMTRWKMEDMRKWAKVWQKNLPGRFKGFHYYNAGAFFEVMMTMARPFLSKKFQDRIHVHNTLEGLYKHIPMELLPDEYLPDDYKGPSVGSLESLSKKFFNAITDDKFRSKVVYATSGVYGIDENKRPKVNDEVASFRKLNLE